MKSKQNKNAMIIFALLALAIIVSGVFLCQKFLISREEIRPVTPVSNTSEVKNIPSKNNDDLVLTSQAEVPPLTTTTLGIHLPYGLSTLGEVTPLVVVPGSGSGIKNVSIGSKGETVPIQSYWLSSPLSVQALDQAQIEKLKIKFDAYFKNAGFTIDAGNTLQSNNFSEYDQSLGYKKDTMLCVVLMTVQSTPGLTVHCEEQNTAVTEFQNKVLKFLLSQDKENVDTSDWRVQVGASENAFVAVNKYFLGGPGGMSYILKQTGDNAWRIVYEGQDIVSCALVQKEHIPKSILGSAGCMNY